MSNGKAEYWEGFTAATTRQPCRYDPDKTELRQAWAEGFASAVEEQKSRKVWWRSNTIRTALICLTAGVVMLLYGRFFSGVGSADEMMSAGGGMSVGAIMSMGIRKMMNDTPIYSGYGGGGGTSWYNGGGE